MREGGIVFVSFLDEVVVCLAKIQVYDEKQALYQENFRPVRLNPPYQLAIR